jgi:hypothetical protein
MKAQLTSVETQKACMPVLAKRNGSNNRSDAKTEKAEQKSRQRPNKMSCADPLADFLQLRNRWLLPCYTAMPKTSLIMFRILNLNPRGG